MSNAGEITDVEVDDAAAEARAELSTEVREENIRCVRIGHGANCSSVGSVIDTLFLGAAVGGAIFAAVCAAMKAEGVTLVGGDVPATSGQTKADAPEPNADAPDEESAS